MLEIGSLAAKFLQQYQVPEGIFKDKQLSHNLKNVQISKARIS